MDDIDKTILMMLQKDDKTPYSQIAKKLEIGVSTVHFRIKRLLDQGVIEGFAAVLSPEKVGYSATAWVGLSVDPRKIESVAKRLAKHPEVQIVASCTGTHDLVVQIVAKDAKDVWRFINKNIKTLDAVGKAFDVSTFLDVYKRSGAIRLD